MDDIKILKIFLEKLLKNYIKSKNIHFKIIFLKNINFISVSLLLITQYYFTIICLILKYI